MTSVLFRIHLENYYERFESLPFLIIGRAKGVFIHHFNDRKKNGLKKCFPEKIIPRNQVV